MVVQGKGPVFLMAATLRPETMYGQTNCWALPKGQYGAFRGLDGEVWVMTHRAARNLAFQDRTPEASKAECLLELQGSDLIGLSLKVTCAWLYIPLPFHSALVLLRFLSHSPVSSYSLDCPSNPGPFLFDFSWQRLEPGGLSCLRWLCP